MFGMISASLSSILIGQKPDEILPPSGGYPVDIRRISGGGISNFPAQKKKLVTRQNRDEEVSLDLREETASIILHEPIFRQKVAAEYRVFHFCTNKSVQKKLTSSVYFSPSRAEGRNGVAAGASQCYVDRPGAT